MPPKLRKKNDKKSLPLSMVRDTPVTTGEASQGSCVNGLSQEEEDKFELELYWCIQQLEMCLASGKIQGKEATNLGKNINVLKGNSVPLIKKRQVMRNTLGDYRKKMSLDEQKFSKNISTVRFNDKHTPSQKSVYLKKAASQRICTSTEDNTNFCTKSDCGFKFNF